MKHLKALVVKALMIWAILWIVLSGIYDVSFMDSTIVGVIIVVMIYVLGDLVIFRKIGTLRQRSQMPAQQPLSYGYI